VIGDSVTINFVAAVSQRVKSRLEHPQGLPRGTGLPGRAQSARRLEEGFRDQPGISTTVELGRFQLGLADRWHFREAYLNAALESALDFLGVDAGRRGDDLPRHTVLAEFAGIFKSLGSYTLLQAFFQAFFQALLLAPLN
jgi:hypothetical protein